MKLITLLQIAGILHLGLLAAGAFIAIMLVFAKTAIHYLAQ